MMVLHILWVFAVVPYVTGLCLSPVLHGHTPDVILSSVMSSEIFCPPPQVFDHFACVCIDPRMGNIRVPTEGRTSLELSELATNPRPASPRPFHLALPAGLPDTHPQNPPTQSWQVVEPLRLRNPSRSRGTIVPALNPFGSYNVPANSEVLRAAAKAKLAGAALPTKQQEILEKARWREQLEREASAVAAAVAAAQLSAPSAGPVSTGVGSEFPLDVFMRDTLRRILYGY